MIPAQHRTLFRHTTDYFLSEFNMSPEHSQALQAVHGAVHQSDVGVKYTWIGAGYISNMYYKWIANHATYDFEQGGDLSFNDGMNVKMVAYGDSKGKPKNQTGWTKYCQLTSLVSKHPHTRLESKLHVSVEYTGRRSLFPQTNWCDYFLRLVLMKLLGCFHRIQIC